MAGRDVNFGLSPEQVAARSADAAKNSAEAAVGALRPWVTFTNMDLGDFVFAAGLARVSLTFQLTNTGRSPAQDVSVHSIGRLSPISQEEQDFAINSVIGKSTGGGYAVFPGDYHKFLNMVMFRNEEIVTAPFFKKMKIIAPQILSAVEYRFQFSAQTHRTAYILNLSYEKDGKLGFDVSGECTAPGADIKIHIQRSFAD